MGVKNPFQSLSLSEADKAGCGGNLFRMTPYSVLFFLSIQVVSWRSPSPWPLSSLRTAHPRPRRLRPRSTSPTSSEPKVNGGGVAIRYGWSRSKGRGTAAEWREKPPSKTRGSGDNIAPSFPMSWKPFPGSDSKH